MVDEPGKKNRRVKAPFDPAIQVHIGQQLRAMYDEVARQPVPDDLVKLLDALGGNRTAEDGGKEAANSAATRAPAGGKSPETA